MSVGQSVPVASPRPGRLHLSGRWSGYGWAVENPDPGLTRNMDAAGLERVYQALGQAPAGHGLSPESVAPARKRAS